MTEDSKNSRFDTVAQSIGRQFTRSQRAPLQWQASSSIIKSQFSALFGMLNLPHKSIALFVMSWLALETALPLLIVAGVVLAGDVWTVFAMVPFMIIGVYLTMLISCSNIILQLIIQLSNKETMFKAIAKGYLWGLFSIGAILMIHSYFITRCGYLFTMDVVFLVPIEGSFLGIGGTIPIPVFLGVSGIYIIMAVKMLVIAIATIACATGGLEILQYVVATAKKHGVYGLLLALLLVAVFPTFNVVMALEVYGAVLTLLG